MSSFAIADRWDSSNNPENAKPFRDIWKAIDKIKEKIDSFFDVFVTKEELNSRIYGVVICIVTDNNDPDRLGRVRVKYPWIHDSDSDYESYWARIVTPMAGKGVGNWSIPEVDDEVLCVFEHGDIRFPYILGYLYNGKESPPDDGKDNETSG